MISFFYLSIYSIYEKKKIKKKNTHVHPTNTGLSAFWNTSPILGWNDWKSFKFLETKEPISSWNSSTKAFKASEQISRPNEGPSVLKKR